VTEMIELAGRDALRPIVERSASTMEFTIANRVFMDPAGKASDSEASDRLLSSNPKVLDSHLISHEMRMRLNAGELDTFLKSRREAVLTATRQFLASRTERESADRPSIAQLVMDV